jgi:hypothetical protein
MANPLLFVVTLQVTMLCVVAWVWRSGIVVLGFLASLSLTWAVVALLVSGHIALATHALWVVPIGWLLLAVIKKRRSAGKGWRASVTPANESDVAGARGGGKY